MIAVSGNAARHSQTARTATGCTGAPESPPPPAPRTGRPVSVSRARPSSVFTSVSPSAPPSSAPVAISTTSGTLGLSLAQRGRPHLVAAMTRAVASAEWANTRDRSSTLGQLTLTSSAAIQRPGSVFAAATTSSAARPYSATVRPQMLTTTRAPAAASAGRSCSAHAARPGPCSPTLLSIPAPTSCTRGAGLPAQGPAERDFTTTAPSAERSP